jgi:hypothetical protein
MAYDLNVDVHRSIICIAYLRRFLHDLDFAVMHYP